MVVFYIAGDVLHPSVKTFMRTVAVDATTTIRAVSAQLCSVDDSV